MSVGKSDRNEFRVIVGATILLSLLCIWLMFSFGNPKSTETDPQQPGNETDAESQGETPGTGVFADRSDNTGTPKGDGWQDARANASEQSGDNSDAVAQRDQPPLEVQIQRGRAVYKMTCFGCHQPDGQGIPGQIPPLAKSDFLLTNTKGSIRNVLMGCTGELVVNDKTYKGTMLPLYHLADEYIANVLTYARNSWGNSGEPVTAEEVARLRQETGPPPALAE